MIIERGKKYKGSRGIDYTIVTKDHPKYKYYIDHCEEGFDYIGINQTNGRLWQNFNMYGVSSTPGGTKLLHPIGNCLNK